MPSKQAHSGTHAWRLAAAWLSLLTTVCLFTTCIPTEPTSPVEIKFQLTPDSLLLAIGEQRQPAVQVTADGASIPEPRLAINTLDATTVTVDEQNRVAGKRRGRTSIAVRLLSGALGDVDADSTFPVRVIVGRLAMAHASDTLTALGDTVSCRPGFRDGAGNVITGADSANLTDDLTFELSSSGNAVELLTAHGRVQALANGVDTMRATLDTSSVEFEIVVEQRPARVVASEHSFTFRSLQEPHQFSAEVFDALDNAMAGSDLSWHSTDESVVTVAGSGSSVTATSAANGSASIVASVDGVEDTVAITVQQVPRGVRIVSGDGQSGTVGQPLASPFVAQVIDSVGHDASLAGTGVTFRVTAGGGSFGGAGSVEATADDQGRASATLTLGTAAGANEVEASVADQFGSPVTFTATGSPAPAASMAAVSGDGQQAGAGAALPQPFVVVVRDTYDNPVPDHDVTFTVTAGGGSVDGSSTTTVQTDASGQASVTLTLGTTAGEANTVEASSSGLTGSPVTFTATALVPVATVDVTPAADTVDVGNSTTLTATLLDASGDTITGRPVSWSSSDDQVAQVDGGGTVQGLAAGDVTITATSENASGSATMAVLGSVATIDVTPDPAEMYAEDTLRLSAAMADAAGHPLDRTVSWSSTDESIATVDEEGLVTGVWPGTDSIIAEAEGKADTVELTVLAIPVASVSVFPQELSLYAVNETAQLAPEARDSVGELINTATFNWASRDVSVATVDQNGEVTAQNTGDTYVVVTSGSQSDSAHVTVLIPTELSCDDAGAVLHDQTITTSETWGRGVHRVSPQLVVDGDVVLTVEPGALICLGGGDDITFQNGARLDARGKPDSLIIWTGDPGNVWYAMRFTGSPADTSYITNALIENAADGSGAVVTQDRHGVVLDSVVVRNTRWTGVTLNAPGSRLSRSVVSNTGMDGWSTAVLLGDSTTLEETTVQGSSGIGVQLQSVDVRLRDVRIENSGDVGLDVADGSLAEGSGIRVVGSGSYGVRTSIQNFALLAPTQAAQDSLLGNARDSVLIAGPLTDATAIARADLPWRLESNLHIQSGGVLVAEPGASLAATAEWMFIQIENGGRIDARGTATDTVVFTMTAEADGWWEGLELTGTGPDTNYLSHALVEHGRNPDGGSWNHAAVVATDQQPLVIEHSRIRASSGSAAWVHAPGSRLTSVVVDSTFSGMAAVSVRNAVTIDSLVIRGSGGDGLDMSGTLAAVSGVRVVDAASYPVVTSFENLGVWNPSAADYDSLLGNGRDTLIVTGGTLSSDTVTAFGSFPWRVDQGISLENTALLRAEAGASIAFQQGQGLYTHNGGRVAAVGAAGDSVFFTAADVSSGAWGGIRLEGSPGPAEPSRFSHVVIEHADGCTWDGSYNCAALTAAEDHTTIVDSSRIRQTESAIWLDAPGSLLRDVVVDTLTSGNTAVWLGDSTSIDGLTVRASGGTGVHMGGPLLSAAGLRVVDGGYRPLSTPIENLGLLIQTAADYDSLRGNAADTLNVTGGRLRLDTLPLAADFPWYVDGSVYFDSLSLLEIEPGAHLAFNGNGELVFDQTGRLWARGTETDTIVFTGAWDGTWNGLLFQSAEGDPFTPQPRDTSYLTNVLIEYTHGIADGAGVVSQQVHALIIDSAVIRQSNSGAFRLDGYGSRISRSVIDTSYAGGWTASLGDSTTLEETVIRPSANGGWGLQLNGSSDQSGTTVRDFQILDAGSGGLDAGWSDAWIENGHIEGSGDVGFQAYGQLDQAWNVRVTGSGSYGARLSIHNLGLLTETAGDQDSLLGNARDTLVITGGRLQNDTVTVRVDVPWRLEAHAQHAQVDQGGLLVAEPGARIGATTDGALQFMNGGRLDARGTTTDSIAFTVADVGGSWRGMVFGSPADTSYLKYVRIERARSVWDDSQQWALQAHNNHPLVIENSLIRQSFYGAVGLFSPGSRIAHTRVDTTGSSDPNAAVELGDSTTCEATTVRRSLSRGVYLNGRDARILGGSIENSASDGLYVYGTLTEGAMPRVTGSGSYGLVTTLPALAALVPDAGTYDSLAGNATDTVLVNGDWSLQSDTVVAVAAHPWLLQSSLRFDGGLLRALPGSQIVVPDGQSLQFGGGRLEARGTNADTVVFTALDPANRWEGMDFSGSPGTPSYLINTRVEYAQTWDGSFNHAAVVARNAHALIIDSTVIRQSPLSAVYLASAGSRFSRSIIDTTNTTDDWREAVNLFDAVILEDVVIRSSGGEGLQMTGPSIERMTGLTVVDAAHFPVVTSVPNLGIWGPTATDYANLTGNGRDTLVVAGGNLSNDTIVASGSLPWLVSGGFTVDGGAVFVAEPGAAIAMSQGVALGFQSGGRLDARGTAADSVVFTSRDTSLHWASLSFRNAPSDSSYIINARIEHPGEYGGAALESWDRHALILDSVLIRQAGHGGVQLNAPGSRLNRSRIDTTGTVSSGDAAVLLGDSTSIVDVAVIGAGGVGVSMDNNGPSLLEVRGLRVTEAASYPVVTSMENLALWQPTSASYDSLVGNLQGDTLLIQSWGTASSGDLLVAEAVPWRVQGYIDVEGSAVLRAEPGATIAFNPNQKLHAQNGGRLDIHGSDSLPVLMTVTEPGQTWEGIWLGNTPSDTSRLVNVQLEHVRQWGNWPDPAVYAQNPHPVVIDSSLIRQSASGVYLGAPGSRFANSVVDTTFTDAPAVKMDGGTEVQSIVVRKSAGVGFDFTAGTLAAIDDLHVVETSGYPLNLTPQNLAVWSPTATDDDNLALKPQENDSVTVQDGDAAGATMVAGSSVVWRLEGELRVGSGAVLQTEPGTRFVATQNWHDLTFQNGGRLEAVGTETDSVVFTLSDTNSTWQGLKFYGNPGDTSLLQYARVEHVDNDDGGRNNAAVVVADQHPVHIDNALIRRSSWSGVWLEAPGSRLTNSVIDTTHPGDNREAVRALGSTTVENVLIRGSGGQGLRMVDGDLTAVSGLEIVESGQLPLVTSAKNLGIWNPSTAAYDSLRGNAQDTLIVTGGTMSTDTITATAAYPWRLVGTLTLGTDGLLAADAGAYVAVGSNDGIQANDGGNVPGRVELRGSATAPVVFTGHGGDSWNGFWLDGTPGDTSYFVNVRIEHAGQDWTDPAAIIATGSHAAIIDSSHIFEPRGRGVWLGTAGSRITRSTITSSGWEWGGYEGARLSVATTFAGNTVTGSSGHGVYITASDVTVSGSEITGSGGDGVLVENGSNIFVNGCNLYDNASNGLTNWTSSSVDATDNWWGDADGPTGTNGDGVSGPNDISPWATAPFTITSPAPAPLAAITVTRPSEPDEEIR